MSTFEIVLKIKNKVFKLFEKGEKTKEELHTFTRSSLAREGIGFPRRYESYSEMVDRLAEEKSPEIIPNGTDPYEQLFKFFGLTVD